MQIGTIKRNILKYTTVSTSTTTTTTTTTVLGSSVM